MWLYVFVQQFFMVIFQKLNESNVTVSRSLNTHLSKILKIQIISKFTSIAIQCNIRTTGDSAHVMKCQMTNQMTVMCTGQ